MCKQVERWLRYLEIEFSFWYVNYFFCRHSSRVLFNRLPYRFGDMRMSELHCAMFSQPGPAYEESQLIYCRCNVTRFWPLQNFQRGHRRAVNLGLWLWIEVCNKKISGSGAVASVNLHWFTSLGNLECCSIYFKGLYENSIAMSAWERTRLQQFMLHKHRKLGRYLNAPFVV